MKIVFKSMGGNKFDVEAEATNTVRSFVVEIRAEGNA